MIKDDDIEKLIRTHRGDFDSAVPGSRVWAGIEKAFPGDLRPERKVKTAHRFFRSGKRWISAAAVLFLGIFLAAFIRTYQVKSEMANTAIPADLRDAQAYYESMIESKIRDIKALPGPQQYADTSLLHMLGERDAEYDRIRDDLHSNPGNPHVRAAFIEYYRSRLEVLKRIKAHLEK